MWIPETQEDVYNKAEEKAGKQGNWNLEYFSSEYLSASIHQNLIFS